MTGNAKKLLSVIVVTLVVTLIFCLPLQAQDDISIRMSLDRTVIGLNESAVLSIEVSSIGSQRSFDPKLPPLSQFKISSAGSSTNLQIVNGDVSYSQTYNYLLFPKKEGTFPIREAAVVVEGKRYTSNKLSLKVVKSSRVTTGSGTDKATDSQGKSRDFFLDAEIDNKNPYVDEQVTLTIRFLRAIRLLSSPDYIPPQTPGFWTMDIPPQNQYYQTIDGREYLVSEIRTALYPTKPGKLKIGSAQVTATVADRRRSRNRDPFSFFDNVFSQGRKVSSKSKPLTVTVKPLPAEGKPDDFSGGVGRYDIKAAVDKTQAEVNEAINLTIRISGTGNVKSIPEPTLPKLDDFRVEKSSSGFKTANNDGRLGGTKTFEYVIIPRLPGEHTIDAITLNYFDPSRRKYNTVATRPIKLTIKQGELSSGTEIPYNMVSGQTINLNETDIRFIKTDNGKLVPKGKLVIRSPLFITILALPPVVLIGSIIDIRRRRRLAGDVGYARLRRANSMAKKRLKKAESLLGGNDGAFYAEISQVILQFIADKFNLSASGLVVAKVESILREREVDVEIRREIVSILGDADFGRFAGSGSTGGNSRELYDRARNVVVKLEEAL